VTGIQQPGKTVTILVRGPNKLVCCSGAAYPGTPACVLPVTPTCHRLCSAPEMLPSPPITSCLGATACLCCVPRCLLAASDLHLAALVKFFWRYWFLHPFSRATPNQFDAQECVFACLAFCCFDICALPVGDVLSLSSLLAPPRPSRHLYSAWASPHPAVPSSLLLEIPQVFLCLSGARPRMLASCWYLLKRALSIGYQHYLRSGCVWLAGADPRRDGP